MTDDEGAMPVHRPVLHALVLAGVTALALTVLTAIPAYAPPPPEAVTSASPAWEPSPP